MADQNQKLCDVCGKPAAITEIYYRSKKGAYMVFCYEHHMDNLSGLTIEDMAAGKKRPGLF